MRQTNFSSLRQRRPYAEAETRRHSGLALSIAAIAFLTTWAAGATLYILFNDDALRLLAARQMEIARSYETQAASLQAEIDRLRSLKLIDQERVDRAVANLARRQTTIERRQSALAALAAEIKKDGDAPEFTGALPAEVPAATPAPKPTPLSHTILLESAAGRFAQLQSRPLPAPPSTMSMGEVETATGVHLANLSRGLMRVETMQSRVLNRLETRYDDRRRRMQNVLDELGIDTSRRSLGGPFLPWTKPPDDPFGRQLHRIRVASAALEALKTEIDKIPVRQPTAGEADVTSTFGLRLDPFLRQPALHTGVDFRGDPGDPVFATAAGRVTQAERNGGYGLMVEIDHGNGLSSRYAHLSALTVAAGETVAPGDPIGRVGSTGRSTGPHLHYEIRMRGDATDPQRFLRAGLRLN